MYSSMSWAPCLNQAPRRSSKSEVGRSKSDCYEKASSKLGHETAGEKCSCMFLILRVVFWLKKNAESLKKVVDIPWGGEYIHHFFGGAEGRTKVLDRRAGST